MSDINKELLEQIDEMGRQNPGVLPPLDELGIMTCIAKTLSIPTACVKLVTEKGAGKTRVSAVFENLK